MSNPWYSKYSVRPNRYGQLSAVKGYRAPYFPSTRTTSRGRYNTVATSRARPRSFRPTYVPRLIAAGPELKSFDSVPADQNMVLVAAVAGAATMVTGLTVLNNCVAGNTFYQRQGNQITMKSLNVVFACSLAAAADSGLVRYLVILDSQPNKAYPAIADVLQTNDAGTFLFDSQVCMLNRSRFTVLRDKIFELDSGNTQIQNVHEYIPLNSVKATYAASAGTIGDLSTNSILLMAFYALCGTAPVFKLCSTRLRYYDN